MRIYHLLNVGPHKPMGLLTLPEIESDLQALWGERYQPGMLKSFIDLYLTRPGYMCHLTEQGEEIFNGPCDAPCLFVGHCAALEKMAQDRELAAWAGSGDAAGMFEALIYRDALADDLNHGIYQKIMNAYSHRQSWISQPPQDISQLDSRLASLCQCGCATGRFMSGA
ncbi:hypothetical protein GC177_02365 [bacterium]|nr:hypothetical protein [bacterium]